MKFVLLGLMFSFAPARANPPPTSSRTDARPEIGELPRYPLFEPRWPPFDAHSIEHREFYSAHSP